MSSLIPLIHFMFNPGGRDVICHVWVCPICKPGSTRHRRIVLHRTVLLYRFVATHSHPACSEVETNLAVHSYRNVAVKEERLNPILDLQQNIVACPGGLAPSR